MSDLRVADFDFHLPKELIAQHPPAERGQSRMLLVNRCTGGLRDTQFSQFPAQLRDGDLLVLNDTRVIPARLFASRTSVRNRQQPTGIVEVLLTESAGQNLWRVLVKPGKKVQLGDKLIFPSPSGAIGLEAVVLERWDFGERLLRFEPVEDFFASLDQIGHIPLPPYIQRSDEMNDRERYQTVFADVRGSVAAPTAGLHFSSEMLEAIATKGVEIARLTLHVGLGTFAPLRAEKLDEIHLHLEHYTISESTLEALSRARNEGRRIVAVGTTAVRALEAAALNERVQTPLSLSATTSLFIAPGHKFQFVDAMLTNFHLPRSSLLMLVSAFVGREQVLAAYRHAVAAEYRFFSYGDCMFLA